jgi:hypothetical protein
MLAGMIVFGFAFASYVIDTRRYRHALAERRDESARLHGVDLTSEAPSMPVKELSNNQDFLVFDRITGDLLGTLSGSELRSLLAQHQELSPETNDFYMLAETLEVLDDSFDPAARQLLQRAFETRDDIELRWVPHRSRPDAPV